MTLLARNEEDILREHILFHLNQGVDFIIATNNLSTDSTSEIMHEFERLGVLHYIYEDQDTHNQSEWVTKMAKMAAVKYSADWVINSDADEFWWPVQGNLQTTLLQIPANKLALKVERYNFMPNSPSFEPFYKRMLVRDENSTNCFGKPLPPKSVHRASECVNVSNGNHIVRMNGAVMHYSTQEIEILHFPIRSWEQFQLKIITGANALQRNQNLSTVVGSSWRYLNELNTKGELVNYYKSMVLSLEQIESGSLNSQYRADFRLLNYLQNIIT
jgi:hypothetical protein